MTTYRDYDFDPNAAVDALFDDEPQSTPLPQTQLPQTQPKAKKPTSPLRFGAVEVLAFGMGTHIGFMWLSEFAQSGLWIAQLLIAPKTIMGLIVILGLVDRLYPSSRDWFEDSRWITAVISIVASLYLWMLPAGIFQVKSAPQTPLEQQVEQELQQNQGAEPTDSFVAPQ